MRAGARPAKESRPERGGFRFWYTKHRRTSRRGSKSTTRGRGILAAGRPLSGYLSRASALLAVVAAGLTSHFGRNRAKITSGNAFINLRVIKVKLYAVIVGKFGEAIVKLSDSIFNLYNSLRVFLCDFRGFASFLKFSDSISKSLRYVFNFLLGKFNLYHHLFKFPQALDGQLPRIKGSADSNVNRPPGSAPPYLAVNVPLIIFMVNPYKNLHVHSNPEQFFDLLRSWMLDGDCDVVLLFDLSNPVKGGLECVEF